MGGRGRKLSNAQSHCNQFMSNKLTPEDYPSPEELQVELERGTVLQTELSAAQKVTQGERGEA